MVHHSYTTTHNYSNNTVDSLLCHFIMFPSTDIIIIYLFGKNLINVQWQHLSNIIPWAKKHTHSH